MKLRKKKKQTFYSLENINSKNCHYNLIFGSRSTGKTYACLNQGLENYFNNGEQFAYVRRWAEDLKRGRGGKLFDALTANGVVKTLSHGEYDNVVYYSGAFKLAKFDNELGKNVISDEVIGYSFAITEMLHDKSTSYPNITTIIFDEFLTRDGYLPNEFVDFMNVISTIVRLRTNVKIYMLGNTVNKYCPYFKEMGLTNIESLKRGEIDVYKYGSSGLRVAVEYADSPNEQKKASNMYFAFNNPKLEMITSGVWELAMYPHCPTKYTRKEILYIYFIEFEQHLLQCEIVNTNNNYFTFIHEKTTELKPNNKNLVYSQQHNSLTNYRRKITKPATTMERKIFAFYLNDRVFYQDNEIGEIVRNYLIWCNTDSIR